MFTRNRIEEERAKGRSGRAGGSVLRAGRAGAAHAEWVFEAIQELKDKHEEGVERIGVWLEEPMSAEGMDAGAVIFRGDVWEEGIGSGVPEWTRLSDDAPLPMEMLSAGMSCQYELEGPKPGPILGPLVGLERVLWVPVLGRQSLRGLVMLGTQEKHKALPRVKAEKVAEELGLLLEFEEERRLTAARKGDLELWQHFQHLLSEPQNGNTILGQLADSCTRGGGSFSGAGAVFALIGERKSRLPVGAPAGASGEEQLLIRAHSGDAAWAHGVNGGPLETLWRQAIENRRVAGAEARHLPLAKEVSRIVAIPLERESGIAGVLLAGLPRRKAILDVMERLELRALLAARVFERERQAQAALQQQLWQKALLESSEEPVVLVDRQGFVVGMSRGARELARLERAVTFARGDT